MQLFKSRDFVWLLIHGKATKLGGWVRGRENEEVFLPHGLFYHLHGQTGRFTDRANGNQNSRLVNFVPESRLPFAQIEIQPVKDGNTNSRLEHSDHKNSFP